MDFFEAIMKILADQGVSVLCVVYLMWFSATKQEKQNELMAQISATLSSMVTRLDSIEERVNKYHE